MISRQAFSHGLKLAVSAVVIAASSLPLPTNAQSGTVRFILPNATGSGVDATARAAQSALAKAFNAAIVVENLPGAGGVVGLQALARSPADGNTLSIVSTNVVILPSVIKAVPFDMPGDFTPIAVVGGTPMVLVTNPTKVPATNSEEFIALLKSKSGALNFASGGNGTILHLATELFLEQVGASAKHIPYKGVGPMVADLVGGHVEFGTAALPSVKAHIQSGALRAIGTLSGQRSPAAPEIPSFGGQGLPNPVVETWLAVLGPKGMSAANVKRVHEAVVAAFADPAVMDAMSKQGTIIRIGTAEEAQQMFRSEVAKYASLVKKAAIVPE